MKTLFYRYPRLLILALVLIVVAGASAYAVLPRAEDPSLRGRVARAVVRYPGADSARVDALVAEPLEQELLEVPEINKLITTSRAGVALVLIQLADEVTETAEVWTRVRAKLDDAERAFPPGASDVDFEEQEIQAYTLITAIRHEGEGPADLAAMGRLARALRDRLRRVPGTEEVELWGAVPEEILVDVSPSVLSSLGRSASDLAAELARSDAKVSAGTLHGPSTDLLLEVTGELDSLARVKGVPVRQASDGRVLRLGDAARVRRGAADPADELALIGGQPAIVVAARMAEGRRIDRWAVKAKQALSEFRRELPRQLTLPVVFDQARYTDARLAELQGNLLAGVLLVILVLVVLMGWRSALLVGLALPLTSLLVLAGMRLLEVPLHQMSVTGLIIALGLLIDNAIVMVDEVEERLRSGLAPAQAISASVGHLAVPLLGSTLTTVLAFMPMVLMPGPAGEFVGAIGLSVTLALIGSLFLALTIVPTLRVLLDRGQPAAAEPGEAEREDAPWWRGGLKTPGLLRVYRAALGSLLARPGRGALLVALPALLGFVAAGALAEQFFPPSDRDQ
ncbi:MAG TPA: acriflavine resistance protein B, partial [Planctomycetes bacterium]|nr:acriflavine resistance protein B [Planctomycetota bacterium]